jgi:hypothetical protein
MGLCLRNSLLGVVGQLLGRVRRGRVFLRLGCCDLWLLEVGW